MAPVHNSNLNKRHLLPHSPDDGVADNREKARHNVEQVCLLPEQVQLFQVPWHYLILRAILSSTSSPAFEDLTWEAVVKSRPQVQPHQGRQAADHESKRTPVLIA